MNPSPTEIDGATVIATADLTRRRSTGRTTHVVGDRRSPELSALAFARYEGQGGVYLFYCDPEWHVITDTLHDSLDAAVDQAVFEFGPIEIRDREAGEVEQSPSD